MNVYHKVASILEYEIKNPRKDCPAPQRNAAYTGMVSFAVL